MPADQIGNLICHWPAKGKDSPPIMLNAHMDTVLPTPEMTPVVKADAVYSDGSSVLGADDKAGVAAIVEAVAMVDEAGLPHGPIDLVFTVGEDVGQFGAAAFDANDVESRVALVLDFRRTGGRDLRPAGGVVQFRRDVSRQRGGGGASRDRQSAVSMMARAIDRMPLGPVDELTVANVGIVSGGDAGNIIPPEAKLVAQARALTQEALDRQVAAMRTALEDGAAAFGGRVEIETEQRFKPTQFGHDHPRCRWRMPESRRRVWNLASCIPSAAATRRTSTRRGSTRRSWARGTRTFTRSTSGCRTRSCAS